MTSKIWRAGVTMVALASLDSAQDAPLFIENVNEWKAIELKSKSGRTSLATMTIKTGWTQLGM